MLRCDVCMSYNTTVSIITGSILDILDRILRPIVCFVGSYRMCVMDICFAFVRIRNRTSELCWYDLVEVLDESRESNPPRRRRGVIVVELEGLYPFLTGI